MILPVERDLGSVGSCFCSTSNSMSEKEQACGLKERLVPQKVAAENMVRFLIE